MELSQLSDQYLQRADALLERIHRLNVEAGSLDGNALILMKRRIASLYADAAQCRRCATLLINYCKGDLTNEQNDLQS